MFSKGIRILQIPKSEQDSIPIVILYIFQEAGQEIYPSSDKVIYPMTALRNSGYSYNDRVAVVGTAAQTTQAMGFWKLWVHQDPHVAPGSAYIYVVWLYGVAVF